MSMNKMEILNEIEKHAEGFRVVPSQKYEYRIRCPFCGDSDNPRDAHCYIHCSPDPMEPIKWHCFHCPGTPNGGNVGSKFLKALGINPRIISSLIPARKNTYEIIDEALNIDPGQINMSSPQVKYLEERLGSFKKEDIQKFKIIWDMNVISFLMRNKRDRNTMPNNLDSISFLTHDNGMILSRGFNPRDKWIKKKIIDTQSFYTISEEIDIFTDLPIYISIGEGIFDVLSAYRNFREKIGYNVFIAALGPEYWKAMEFGVAMGLVGSNINVIVYADADRNLELLNTELKKYKRIFGSIKIRMNLKSKDIGVPRDQILLTERIVR